MKLTHPAPHYWASHPQHIDQVTYNLCEATIELDDGTTVSVASLIETLLLLTKEQSNEGEEENEE